MLYVTTRSNRDAFTAQRVLQNKRGPDGGLFVPLRCPQFSPEEIDALAEKSFNCCIADILNILFNTKLTSWDVDFCIGRHSVRVKSLGNRLLMGECWHNLDGQFSKLVTMLSKHVCTEKNAFASEWAEIAVRISVLFGIFAELIRQGIAAHDKLVDISVVSADFSAPISAWYARQWGLPIGNIVCCCNENGNLWDFICHGQLRTDSIAVRTITPEADIQVPYGLERLIHAYAGAEEVNRFVDICRKGRCYYIDDKLLHNLRQGIYITVTSSHRILSTIPGVYATHAYLLSPYSALAYSGLQDYRSRTGENRYGLVMAWNPTC